MFDFNIPDVMIKFHICTYLPILALLNDGSIIGSSGYNNDFHYLLRKHNIKEKTLTILGENREKEWIHIPILKNTYFTSLYIRPGNPDAGYYIIGPHSCIKNNSFNIPYKPKCLIGNLISLLYDLDNGCCPEKQNHSSYSYHVRKALDYINLNYYENLTLASMADYLNLNKSYFCSLFKKETEKTFTQMVNEVRVEKSKKLLLEYNYSSILDVAMAVGFNNQNYFNISFKKITNMTPLEYKNKK